MINGKIYVYGEDDNYNESIKAACCTCNCVMPFNNDARGTQFCPYCGAEIYDADTIFITPDDDTVMTSYQIITTETSLTIDAMLETPDFWDAEFGDELNCETDEIKIIINNANGSTVTYEGSTRLDYSNGLELNKHDILATILRDEQFVGEFKTKILPIIKRENSFFEGVASKEIFDFAFLANRYPFFSKEQLNKIIHSINANDVYSIIKKIAYDDDATEIIQKLQKECNVKFSKNVIKRFIEDPSSVADIMTFGEYFTNIDLLSRFIDSGLCSIIKTVAPVFIEKIIELRGEPQAINFFMKGLEDETILRDASNCYVSFIPRYEHLLTPNMLRGNLFEVHDKLSEAANNIRYPNENIFYQQEEKNKYEKNVEGIKFALPKTTHELIYIGQELHNCVATYAPKAVSKECTIVYMEQNNELVGCIEIDTTGKYIIQARGHCNELFEGELLRIFNKYAAITGLSTYTCSQQTAAELAGLNPNAHEVLVGLDFHNLEIDENGHVTEL